MLATKGYLGEPELIATRNALFVSAASGRDAQEKVVASGFSAVSLLAAFRSQRKTDRLRSFVKFFTSAVDGVPRP